LPVTYPDPIELFVEPLEALAITYMVTGGVASVIYGEPRFTRDIDLVLELDPSTVEAFASLFAGGDYYVPPLETLHQEVARTSGGHFNVIHRETGLRADVYLVGDDALHHWALERRSRLPLEAIAIWVAPIEYVILRKLEYYGMSGSDRHLRDVANMLRISGDKIDPRELDAWVDRLALQEPLLKARSFPTSS
jgi:hypothetical protein